MLPRLRRQRLCQPRPTPPRRRDTRPRALTRRLRAFRGPSGTAARVRHLFSGWFQASAQFTTANTTRLIQIAICASIIVAFTSDLDGGLIAMLAIFLGGFVFYCAFEAMRTAQAKNMGEVPVDPLETWSAGRPVGPIILIGLGALLLLNNFRLFEFIRLGRLWPLILIGAGLYMFRNKLGGRQ